VAWAAGAFQNTKSFQTSASYRVGEAKILAAESGRFAGRFLFSTKTNQIPMPTSYTVHPIAACYPALPEAEYAALKEHIRLNGLQNEIVLYQEQILDGVHRDRACRELGVQALYSTPEIKDPFEYVVGQNERRRHLTQLQRIEIAEKMASLNHGGDRKTSLQNIKPFKNDLIPIDRQKAAKLNGISVTALDRFRRVRTRAIPELLTAVKAGDIPLATAGEDIASLPRERQKAALEIEKGKRHKSRSRGPEWAKSDSVPATHWETIEAKALARIDQPSLYPGDLPLPVVPGFPDKTKHIQEAILELRPLESQIATMGWRQLYGEVQLAVQRIQSYGNKFTRVGLGDYRIELAWQQWAEDAGQKVQARVSVLLARKPNGQSQLKRRPERSGYERRLWDYRKKLKRLLREIDFLNQEADEVYAETILVVTNYFEGRAALYASRAPHTHKEVEANGQLASSH
jgi:hypothetical protein